ncbi:uncharacterized protein LAESUDRAFT_728819 [Laetiporus sulphureus 93-53]|uniref:DUF6533 domain-containing protein n=1 Tax=Laetiporus sulphureus 93-53 TaxID=1314785 RepID=A0A165CZ84_9APHY|nr:uncharacterized protein LAESUDRAFT_728819 [Laetiporus sulphureus 93-53]KZT03795.1 hypothetical protein LAESUDRAFT_728819 [Laetiporus sulphureus 93-53]
MGHVVASLHVPLTCAMFVSFSADNCQDVSSLRMVIPVMQFSCEVAVVASHSNGSTTQLLLIISPHMSRATFPFQRAYLAQLLVYSCRHDRVIGCMSLTASEVDSSFTQDYAIVAGAALIFFDHAITFGQEVQLFWGERSFSAWLFFANQMLALSYAIISVWSLVNLDTVMWLQYCE